MVRIIRNVGCKSPVPNLVGVRCKNSMLTSLNMLTVWWLVVVAGLFGGEMMVLNRLVDY